MMRFRLCTLLIALLVAAPVTLADDKLLPPVAVITQPFIEMHTGPGRGYPVFYVTERSERVELLKQRTGWVKVRTLPRGPMDVDSDGNPIPGSNTKEGWVRLEELAQSLDENGDPIALKVPRFDDYTTRNWELGVMFGDFGGSDAISAYTGYHFTRNISVELELAENFGNFSSGQSATLNLVHQPFPDWRYSPFFSLGGGVRKTDPRSTIVETEDRTDDVLVVGGGVRIYLTSRFLMRLQYKKHTVLTSRDDDIKVEEWKIGLSAFF